MSKKDLKLEPHIINDNVWWYEDKKGIDLHIDAVLPSGQRSHQIYLIPWKDLRSALKRKDILK